MVQECHEAGVRPLAHVMWSTCLFRHLTRYRDKRPRVSSDCTRELLYILTSRHLNPVKSKIAELQKPVLVYRNRHGQFTIYSV